MARILIADDDRDYLSAFQSGMQLLGHEVDCVVTAEDARATFQMREHDIVFVDFVMPGGGALTLVHELFNLQPQLPVVVISGKSELYDTPVFREGLRMARAVLRKTASLREIDDIVRQFVELG